MGLGLKSGVNWKSIALNGGGGGGADLSAFIFAVNIPLDGGVADFRTASITGQDYRVNWGDGTSEALTPASNAIISHTYTTAGVYDVSITGTAWKGMSGKGNVVNDIIEIKQWGTASLYSFNFSGNIALTTVSATDAPILSGVTLFGQVGRIDNAFFGCSSLTSINNIGSWDMSGVVDIRNWFWRCGSLTSAGISGILSWDTSNITNMNLLFTNTSGAGDLDFTAWNISSLISAGNFIPNDGISVANYDATLIGWASQAPALSSTTIGFNNNQYTLGGAAEAARNTLINTYGWTITDGGGISILNNLVSYFKMDDDMIDTIDGQAPTTNVYSTYEAGVVLDARSFNGANEYAIYSGNEKYNMSDGTSDIPFSISFWLKINDATNNQARILNVARSNQGWQYRIQCSGTTISLDLFSQSNIYAGHYKAISVSAGSIGDYHHFVFTYDGSLSQGMKAYRDGVLISSSAGVIGAYTGMRDITPDYCFGRRTNINAGYLKGSLDEFGVFKNKVLEATHVQDLYNKGFNGVALNEVYVPSLLDTATVRFIVSNASSLTAEDTFIKNILDAQVGTVLVSGASSGEYDAITTHDFTVIAESIFSNMVASLKSETKPILTLEASNHDEFYIGVGVADNTNRVVTSTIINSAHPILGTLTAPITYNLTGATVQQGAMSKSANMLNSNYVLQATDNNTHYPLVVVDSGDTLADLTIAAGKRVFLGGKTSSQWSADVQTIFVNSLKWMYNVL